MSQFNRFVIHNNFSGTVLIDVEPEGAITSLTPGEEVHVSERFEKHPVTLNISLSDEGFPMVAVWPGDGKVRVEKGGVDVLDLR